MPNEWPNFLSPCLHNRHQYYLNQNSIFHSQFSFPEKRKNLRHENKFVCLASNLDGKLPQIFRKASKAKFNLKCCLWWLFCVCVCGVCVMEKQIFDVAFIYFSIFNRIFRYFFSPIAWSDGTNTHSSEKEEAYITMHSITFEWVLEAPKIVFFRLLLYSTDCIPRLSCPKQKWILLILSHST